MDLQQSLDRFKADLQAYIQAEVSRQLAAQMRNIASSGARTTQSTAPIAQSSEASIQASLDELAALAQTTPRENSNAVDRLVNEFGGVSQASVQESSDVSQSGNANYLNDLAQLGQAPRRINDMTSYNELTSIGSGVSVAMGTTQPPQPVATNVNSSSAGGAEQLSGIQSFLQKIRQRKNLSSN